MAFVRRQQPYIRATEGCI